MRRELLAIVDTIRASRVYLHGTKFIVKSYLFPLKYLETQENLSQRQVRWLETLVDFDSWKIQCRCRCTLSNTYYPRIPSCQQEGITFPSC